MSTHPDIEPLIDRIAMGDRSALRQLYDRFAPRLFGLCHEILADPGAAEDALEEVFAAIWTGAGRYDPVSAAPAVWLDTLARDIAVARRRAMSVPPRDPEGVRPHPDRAEPALSRPEAQAFAACLRAIPPDSAAMLRRAWLHGADYGALAAASGSTPDDLRPRLRRALMQIRECLSR